MQVNDSLNNFALHPFFGGKKFLNSDIYYLESEFTVLQTFICKSVTEWDEHVRYRDICSQLDEKIIDYYKYSSHPPFFEKIQQVFSWNNFKMQLNNKSPRIN